MSSVPHLCFHPSASTKALSLESLHDVGGKSNIAWRLKCDAFVLCSDGNVFDALLLAVVGALQSVAVPRVKSMKDGSQPVIEEGGRKEMFPVYSLG